MPRLAQRVVYTFSLYKRGRIPLTDDLQHSQPFDTVPVIDPLHVAGADAGEILERPAGGDVG